ncbi:MAG: aspartate aminotransferase family protein, partial [Gammaproteobacteria bacterium]|nr:aspartate aminotransferase family protein [Gammaproteobacteria bacterium]
MTLMEDDLDRIEHLSTLIAEWSASFLKQVDQQSVAVTNHPRPLDEPLATDGLGAEVTFAEFKKHLAPGLSGSVGPRYLGFVTGGVTPAAMLGDWLTAAIDQNVM